MIIRMAGEQTEAGEPPPIEAIEQMVRYNEELAKAGVLVATEGVHPSVDGARISFKGGKPTITDGPFVGAKELIAGFTIIDVSSRDEALEWVRRWPERDVALELRQVVTADEFDNLTDKLKEVIDRGRLSGALAVRHARRHAVASSGLDGT
jgi:hypothetical protein